MQWEPIMIETWTLGEAPAPAQKGARVNIPGGTAAGRLTRVLVPAWRWSGPPQQNVPPIDESYVMRTDVVRELVWAAWPHDGGPPVVALLTGKPGAGKTTAIEQLAARCNVPVVQLSLNVGIGVPQLKGRRGVHAGETGFIPGPVTAAMEMGAWLILDELAGISPPVALSLLPVLAPHGAVYLEEAEPPRYAARHPNFRVFCTDNTIGADMEESRFSFAGTNAEINSALLDRIGTTVHVPYADAEFDTRVLRNRVPSLDAQVLAGLIKVAISVRQSDAIAGGVFSTRMLVDWARRVAAGRLTVLPDATREGVVDLTYGAVLQAAEAAFLTRMPSAMDRNGIRDLIKRVFDRGTVL